jgi:hypothetical protein
LLKKDQLKISQLSRLNSLIRQDQGNVESALVLIPLTVLFLLIAQLIYSVSWSNYQSVDQQSFLEREAISGNQNLRDQGKEGDQIRYEPLIGGGYLVISERRRSVPLIANFVSVLPGFESGSIYFRHISKSVSEVYVD